MVNSKLTVKLQNCPALWLMGYSGQHHTVQTIYVNGGLVPRYFESAISKPWAENFTTLSSIKSLSLYS
jgi:hypothetical protein